MDNKKNPKNEIFLAKNRCSTEKKALTSNATRSFEDNVQSVKYFAHSFRP